MTTDQAPPAARTSDRGAATRSGLLAAAREVFTSVGYAEAGVTEIVTRAGASVGSLYHHFSGKADLYLTLFEELHRDQVERTRLAGRRARLPGRLCRAAGAVPAVRAWGQPARIRPGAAAKAGRVVRAERRILRS